MWEKEVKIIENLGKLYPDVIGIKYEDYQEDNYDKAWWIYLLCKHQLNQRLLRLERFIKENDNFTWWWYKQYFNIMEE